MKYCYKVSLLQKVKKHIANGGVIIYPTEFCYGIGCDPLNVLALAKILSLKNRSNTKGLIVIASQLTQLAKIIKPLNDNDLAKCQQYWPGPFSLIIDAKPHLPYDLLGRHKKIAVRVTQNKMVRQLCDFLGMAIVSTSANRSGCQPLKTFKDCLRTFGNNALVLPGFIDYTVKPSTIIDLSSNVIIR